MIKPNNLNAHVSARASNIAGITCTRLLLSQKPVRMIGNRAVGFQTVIPPIRSWNSCVCGLGISENALR